MAVHSRWFEFSNFRAMTKTLTDIYQKLLAQGDVAPDAAQAEAVRRFDELARDLAAWKGGRSGLFGWLSKPKAPPPKGIYLHGAVGRGKTMLMDLFFKHVHVKPKRRMHFHEFMADAHERIGHWTSSRRVRFP